MFDALIAMQLKAGLCNERCYLWSVVHVHLLAISITETDNPSTDYSNCNGTHHYGQIG